MYNSMIQKINISQNLIREKVWELGRKEPHYLYKGLFLKGGVVNKNGDVFIYDSEMKIDKNLAKPIPLLESINKGLGLPKRKCDCPMQLLMSEGCKCGGI